MSDAADSSTSAASAVQGAGNGSAGGVCEPCCKSRIKEIDDKTQQIASIKDPIQRNQAITQAYTDVAAQDPQDPGVLVLSKFAGRRTTGSSWPPSCPRRAAAQ